MKLVSEIKRRSYKGLSIYRHIYQDLFPGDEEVINAITHLEVIKNPFNRNRTTLRLYEQGGWVRFCDTEMPDFKGGPMDFARMHYQLTGTALIRKVVEVLNVPFDGGEIEDEEDEEPEEVGVPVQPVDDSNPGDDRNMPMPMFSFFKAPIRNIRQFKDLTIMEAYDLIRSNSYRQNTKKLRELLTPEEARRYKAGSFDYVTFSGTFSTRKDEALKKHSGLMAIDFDHVEDLDQLKKTLLNDPCLETELMFVSPSGDGLKWIVSVNTVKASHLENFMAIEKYLDEKYDLKIDKSGKDVSRACFLPCDPEAYINPNYFEFKTPKKEFDVLAYLNKETRSNAPKSNTHQYQPATRKDVEVVIRRIEQSHTDITAQYSDWRDIGFAFANAFGIEGRCIFHRVSCFYGGYSPAKCDAQYDACLKGTRSGITMNSFFHIAKKAGIDISNPEKKQYQPIRQDGAPIGQPCLSSVPVEEGPEGPDEENAETDLNINPFKNTPRIPESVHANLPVLLRECCDMFAQAVEKDVVLVGALTVLSGCLPNLEGIYFDKKYSPHFYTFITAPAGSGKGILNWAAYLGNSIHDNLVRQSLIAKAEYERELDYFNNLNKNQRVGMSPPLEPIRRKLFIPANCSASAFIQALADNQFRAMLFETEADTLASALKQEWGNFSDVLRKAFHHERASLYRRKDNEFIEITDPHLAILLAGTPKQVQNIMPDVENGLFSRFLYYAFDDHSKFRNPFISYSGMDMPSFFIGKGEQVKGLYQSLNNLAEPIRFRFTESQAEEFTEEFGILYERNRMLLENDFNANSRRLGLITFRIAMVLSALRILEDGHLPKELVCSDLDFQLAMQIVFTLEKHAIVVYQNLPDNKLKGIPMKLYKALPAGFTGQDLKDVASMLGITERTAFRYINDMKQIGLINHQHNWYTKIADPNIANALMIKPNSQKPPAQKQP